MTTEYGKAIQYIYEKIARGELVVGSKLPTERAIAEELGIGRNSLREAISVLNGMGIVERIQGSGNYISDNAGKSVNAIIRMLLALGAVSKSDIGTFRRSMEKSACMVLAEKESIDTSEMEELLEKMDEADEEEMSHFDKELHYRIISETENGMLILMMKGISEIYRDWVAEAFRETDENQRELLRECHRELVRNIAARDLDGMLQAVDRHYDITEQTAVQ